ncbi:MAG: HPP family protein [Acidimicrobiales bacterium]
MKAREPVTAVMTRDPTTVELGDPLSYVYRLLRRAPFHHLPVMDGGSVAGLISATDILRLVYDIERGDDKMLRTMLDHQYTIEDAMSIDLHTLPPTATVRDAAVVLSGGTFHSVLVVDGSGELAGIVTSTDLIRYLRDLA